ncbi:hypothetical protein ONE63_004549 [Megalurothrips usitatus]|uniref:MULE transposase domain-containing protein n=1 Tax=Megalurothrips usitatus TaxID=439358 RepID=A0AAV7X751_9NEOP|nr:hypothetical protein ONE63_004549 [Megalurothrips usitatus]
MEDFDVDDPAPASVPSVVIPGQSRRKDAFPINDVQEFFGLEVKEHFSRTDRDEELSEQADAAQQPSGNVDADSGMFTKRFTITLSPDEWKTISPEIASYKSTAASVKTVIRSYKCLRRRIKHPLLKRQIKGSKRDEYLDMMINQKMSSSCVRALSAEDKMEEGEREPPQVPLARSLRQAKFEYLSSLRLDNDPVMAIILAKHEALYTGFIKNVTYEKFIVPFWNIAQVHAERSYVQNTPNSKISIDASGGFVHKLKRADGKKSGHIFLFEAVIRDPKTGQQVAVASMISERHDTETIRYWLSCFLRDGQLIQCQNIDTARNIIMDIFTVALNESEGKHPVLGHETPAQCSKTRLLRLIGNDSDETIYSELDGIYLSAEEEMEGIFWDGLENMTPNFGKNTADFTSWGEEIFTHVENSIEQGNWGNQQFLPDLPKAILKLTDVIPLWSAIMVPHFGYGSPTASTSSSEGKIKLNNAAALEEKSIADELSSTVDPCKAEDNLFPEDNLPEDSLLPEDHRLPEANLLPEDNNLLKDSGEKKKCGNFLTASDNQEDVTKCSTKGNEEDLQMKDSKHTQVAKSEETPTCHLCRQGICPDPEYSCFCGVAVHANSSCAAEVTGAIREDRNVACMSCSKKTHQERLSIMEQQAKDNWRGLSEPKKRSRKSYLEKNSE